MKAWPYKYITAGGNALFKRKKKHIIQKLRRKSNV